MFCSKCGFQNNNGDKFCKNCGCLIDNQPVQQPVNNGMNGQSINQQSVYNQPQQSINQQFSNTNGNLDPNYINHAINPNMQKWAVLSVIIPVVAMVWYWYIGLSFYLAILIAACGFSFAEKGKMGNKKLAIVGKVCNGLLCGMAIFMLVIQLLEIFMS